MLSDIISRKLPSRCVIIQDSVEQSGRILWEALVQNAVNENRSVHIFCFEAPVKEIRRNIRESDHKKIKFYDGFTDHRNWLQCCNRSDDVNIVETGPKCLKPTNSAYVSESDRVVFIDSLSPLIYSTDSCNCYTQLHKLCKEGHVVCLVHEDGLPNAQATLDVLHHLATTCLRIRPPSSASQGSPVVEIRHSRPGGGVTRQTEKFMIGADKKVISEKMTGLGSTLGINSKQPDVNQLPADLTTFKIDLEQSEKQARSKLVLPYIRPSIGSAAQSGGKVFYHPDAADDWDDEDPDDDLDV